MFVSTIGVEYPLWYQITGFLKKQSNYQCKNTSTETVREKGIISQILNILQIDL